MVENSCGVMQDVLCLHEVVKHVERVFSVGGLACTWKSYSRGSGQVVFSLEATVKE